MERDIIATFDPWLYVSHMMEVLGLKNRLTGVVAFLGIAVPIYLVGCLGLRVIGVPAILRAIFRPNRQSGLRFVLAFFVVIGLLIALTCRIVPTGLERAYNNSAWFLAQSKYVAWIFAVEVLQTLYRHVVARGVRPSLVATGIMAGAVALSVPATVQHFALESDPYRVYGKPLGKELQSYSLETLSCHRLPDEGCAAGRCRVAGRKSARAHPCAYKMPGAARLLLQLPGGAERLLAQRDGREGILEGLAAGKRSKRVIAGGRSSLRRRQQANGRCPSEDPPALSEVFENSEFAVFKVRRESLSEAAPKP